MNIKPLGKRVLIESLPSATMTPGGLHLPQGTEDRSHVARVVAVGNFRPDAEGKSGPMPEIQVGDRVIVSKFQGTEVIVDGKPMRIVDFNAILGVIPDTDTTAVE